MNQIHLTLAFLGEVDDVAIERLAESLATIRSAGFSLRFSGAGCFPNRHRPRVLWVGLEPEPGLNGLASLVREVLLACNIPLEERLFSPHITLARLKLPVPREVAAFLEHHGEIRLPPVDVREFTLFKSVLTSQGAVHTPLKTFELQSA